jgi:hypothetical protein
MVFDNADEEYVGGW